MPLHERPLAAVVSDSVTPMLYRVETAPIATPIGTLAPGKEADIVMLRTDSINVLPINNAYGAIVLGMDTSNVDTVFIAGKGRKHAGRLVDVDVARIRRVAEASRDNVVARAGWPKTLFGGYLPGH